MSCTNCDCKTAATPSYGATAITRAPASPATPLLWPTHPPAATPDDCDGSTSPCCKHLAASDAAAAHHSALLAAVDPDIIRDIIIGLSDGLSVPFALAAGLTGFGSTRIVVIGGLAELVSGAISMGVGGYLSASAERDHFANRAADVRRKVARSCLPELTRDVAAVLEPFGLGHDVAQKVAERLVSVEKDELSNRRNSHSSSSNSEDTLPAPVTATATATAAADSDSPPDHGLTPFLLKVGHGLEPIAPSRAYTSAATIGTAYFLGGLIPLVPYMVWSHVADALRASILLTGAVLLLFGAAKHRFTGGTHAPRAYAWAALSTLAVGGIAAAASWAIVRAIEGHP